MKINSKIPVPIDDIERESPLFLSINNTEFGTLSIFSKQLSLNEYEKFEMTFRYAIFNQLFILDRNDKEIDTELFKNLKDDLNKIRIEPYKFLLKQLIEISEFITEKENNFDTEKWLEFLFNCRQLTQKDLITWCSAILKYNISYKKKVLESLQGKVYHLENWMESDSINSVLNVQDFQPLGEILYGI